VARQGRRPTNVIRLHDLSQEPTPPRRLNPTIPEDLDTVLLKFLARVQSCRTLAALLASIRGAEFGPA
jgi:hypothetical protein